MAFFTRVELEEYDLTNEATRMKENIKNLPC